MYPYPTQFPLEAAKHLIPILKGGPFPDLATSLNAAWELLGYLMSQWYPVSVASAVPPGRLSWKEAADYLEGEVARSEGKSTMALAIPWPLLAPVLWELVKRLIDARLAA